MSSDITIEINTKSFINKLRMHKKKQYLRTTKALREVTKFAKKEAKKRVPRDTKALEDNIRHQVYIKQRIGVVRVRRDPETDKYAIWIHNNTQYDIRKKSKRKQARVGVKVGPRYITRALYDNKRLMKKMIIRRLRRW